MHYLEDNGSDLYQWKRNFPLKQHKNQNSARSQAEQFPALKAGQAICELKAGLLGSRPVRVA